MSKNNYSSNAIIEKVGKVKLPTFFTKKVILIKCKYSTSIFA